MVQRPSWEPDSHSASQEILRRFMQPESSSPCSQEPAAGPYPEPDESSSQSPNISLRSILICSHLCLGQEPW
jgi:hypothetical protein